MLRYFVLSAIVLLFAQGAQAEKAQKISLAAALVKRTNVSDTQAQEQVERVFSVLRAELKDGNNVEVRSFGNFSVRERARRHSKKSAPGAAEKPSEARRKYPHFVSSESLKVELNPQKK